MSTDADRMAWSRLSKGEVTEVGVALVRERLVAEGLRVTDDEITGRTRLLATRPGARTYRVRVATCRPPGGNYAYFTKASFEIADDQLAALVLLEEGRSASAFLIPSAAWRTPSPLLCDRDYVGKASAPEWGIQLTGKSQPYLEKFSFGVQARLL